MKFEKKIRRKTDIRNYGMNAKNLYKHVHSQKLFLKPVIVFPGITIRNVFGNVFIFIYYRYIFRCPTQVVINVKPGISKIQ